MSFTINIVHIRAKCDKKHTANQNLKKKQSYSLELYSQQSYLFGQSYLLWLPTSDCQFYLLIKPLSWCWVETSEEEVVSALNPFQPFFEFFG